MPFRIGGLAARLLLIHILFRVVFHRILTLSTPLGRKVHQRMAAKGDLLIRVRPEDLERAGVIRVARMAGVKDGKPLLEDGTVADVANVIWCGVCEPQPEPIGMPELW